MGRCGSFTLTALGVLLLSSGARAYTVKRTEAGLPVHWQQGTIELRIDASVREVAPPGQVRAAMEMAAEAWRGLTGVPDVRVRVGDPGAIGYDLSGPSNGVYALTDWPYDPQQLAVTVTTYDESTGALIDADVLINAAHAFDLLSERGTGSGDDAGPGDRHGRGGDDRGQDHGRDEMAGYDLGSLLTHELGHVLGLGESHEDPNATMWPNIGRGETHQRSIETDDEVGVIEVYETADAMGLDQAAGGCSGASVAGRSGNGFAAPLASLVALALLIRARRRSVRS